MIKMKMNSLVINLPEDVLMNKILLKLDTKSLGKLRCVCKYLQSLITNPAFVKMHCHDPFNNNPLIFLASGNKSLFYSLSSNGIKPYCPRFFRVPQPLFFGSCNGLLCLVEKNNSPPGLWNPTTKEYKQLPPPFPPRPLNETETSFLSHPDIISSCCSSVVAYGLGYDSIIDDYKVIQCENSKYYRFFPPDGPHPISDQYTITDFQVYTLGTDTWRRINDNPYESYFRTALHYQTPGMFVNGALHWILLEKAYTGFKIIAFDIEREMFREDVPKPHSRLNDSLTWSLHVLKGCLCIYERLHQHESLCIDIWMMKDYGVIESWTILFTIKIFGASAFNCSNFKVLNFCKNGEVIIARDYKYPQDLVLYNPINKKSQKIQFLGGISYTEIHIESLVSLNTGIYRYGKVENKQYL